MSGDNDEAQRLLELLRELRLLADSPVPTIRAAATMAAAILVPAVEAQGLDATIGRREGGA